MKLRAEILAAPDMELDLLILPGGVISGQIAKGEVLAWLRGEAKHVPIIAPVCNGALVLGAAGLLDGWVATMHWEDVSALQERCPTIHIERNMRYVDTGEVVTSAGVSAGIDMSLHLIDRLLGGELDVITARRTVPVGGLTGVVQGEWPQARVLEGN